MTAQDKGGLFIAYDDVWLLDGVRTPFVDYNSALGLVSPTDLGIKAARAVFERAKVSPGDVGSVIAGCVAQAEGQEILERASVVDLVVGPQSYHELPWLVGRVGNGERVVATDFPAEDKFLSLPERPLARVHPSAFITVQEGCDKFCTFCVVPYTRGAEYSRPVAAIIAEAERLAGAGSREITLLGQNVNAYCGEGPDGADWSLAKLLRLLAGGPQIERLRYTTSHPSDMDDDLIALHGDEPKLMPYLHLPFQAGSDRILAAMNRKHSADDYAALVKAWWGGGYKACVKRSTEVPPT